MANPKIQFDLISGFVDKSSTPVPVLKASAGGGNFGAFVYQCKLNLDKDGAPNTYGWNNPNDKNSLGAPNLQKNLIPLENGSYTPGATSSHQQFLGLANACGDPGDGSHGYKNFKDGTGNFYWASVVSLTKAEAFKKVVIDDRDELEALMDTDGNPVAKGSGYYPVVQPATSQFKGYYISTTATVTDKSLPASNPDRWVNAADVPYAVLADAWQNSNVNGKKLKLGDFGLAINNVTGACSGYLYGDAGTPSKVGECSQNLFGELMGDGDPTCTFFAFPGSGRGVEVGDTPEGSIAPSLLPLVAKLALTDNPSALMERIYMGTSMRPSSAKSYQLTGAQSQVYLNVARALNLWGCNFVTEPGKPVQ